MTMPSIGDLRRLRVSHVKMINGEMAKEHSCDAWQNANGTIGVTGTWEGVLVPSQEDLQLRASRYFISPLELLRQRLVACPGMIVEVDAK